MSDEPLSSVPSSPCEPVEPEKITATVTPWDALRMSKEQWDALEIPSFLRRTEGTATVPSGPRGMAPTTKVAPAPAASVSAGASSGVITKPASESKSITAGADVTGGFEHLRVDLNEIEAKIKAEADRLYYTWEGKNRPRKSTLVKRVRKDYYK